MSGRRRSSSCTSRRPESRSTSIPHRHLTRPTRAWARPMTGIEVTGADLLGQGRSAIPQASDLDVDLGVPDVHQDRSFHVRPARVRRSRVSSTSALASRLMALAAASPYAAGRTAVALTGQWIRTTCGVSWPSTSSITRWSFWVMSPSARVIRGEDCSAAGSFPVEALGSAHYANRGRLMAGLQLGSACACASIHLSWNVDHGRWAPDPWCGVSKYPLLAQVLDCRIEPRMRRRQSCG
jgi:hypothetical protein